MEFFISPQWRSILQFPGKPLYEAIWNLEGNWVEPPNHRRGGWSGVSRTELPAPDGPALVYIKRQENHRRLTLRHPIKGEATFAREFRIIRYLREHQVPTLNPLYFGEHDEKGKRQAILMTEALYDYRAFEDMLVDGEFTALPFQHKRRVLAALADTVRKMHDAGVQHRSLYPKHLMVKGSEAFEVALIDLEKSRRSLLPLVYVIRDLSTLNRQTKLLSRSERLYFFRAYLGVAQLGAYERWLGRWIYGRGMRKRARAEALERREAA